MIGALIISNICLILLVKGGPTWLEIALSVGYVICNLTSLIIWEEIKGRIKVLENKFKKKGGVQE